MRKKITSIIFFSIFIFLLFNFVFAQEQEAEISLASEPSLPEEGIFNQGISQACRESGQCTQCDGLQVAINIVHFLFNIAGPLAVLMIILGGFLYVTSGGSEERAKTAKGAVTAGIVGFVIVLIAWIGVDFIIKILGYEKAGSWFRPDLACQKLEYEAAVKTPGIPGAVATGEIKPGIKQGCNASFQAEGEYDQYFLDSARKYNLDPYYLMAIAMTETGIGKNIGPSPTGAYGITQFQPSTFSHYAPSSAPFSCQKKISGKEYESGAGFCVSTKKNPDPDCCEIKGKYSRCERYARTCADWIRNNPDELIDLSAKYLSQLKDKYGSYDVASAKYNGCGQNSAPCDSSHLYAQKVRRHWSNFCQNAGGVLN
ncbi:MAG: transglycosylase SLT domain-containing protein [Patescibacteria group bacterium]